ncbi:MAG: TolC family protein [Longimicrobiales bacterium]
MNVERRVTVRARMCLYAVFAAPAVRALLATAVGLATPAVLHAQGPDSLTLAEAASLALARHPAVVAALARQDAASAGVGVARAAWLPSLRTEASAIRFQEPMIVVPLHAFEPGMVPDFANTLIQGNVAAAWTLYDGGARSARIRGASALEDVASGQRASAERALIAETARAYLRVRLAEEVLSAQAAQHIALAEERDRARQLLDEGKVARIAVLRVNAALARARADSAAAAVERDAARADLARLTGVAAAPAELPASAEVAMADDAAWLSLRARALDASPELRTARARAAAADAARTEARASYLPRVDLSARYNEYGSDDGDFVWEWQGGVLVSYPIFTGGARAHQSERAAAEARAAAADAAAVALRVTENVDRAFAAWRSAQARATAFDAALTAQEEVVRIERLALVEGAGTQTDYLAAEAELLRTRAALTEASHAAIAARIEIARITGELTPAWLADNLRAGS